MKKLSVIQVLLLFFSISCYAQLYNGYPEAAWKLMEFTGGVGVNGMYGSTKLKNTFGLLENYERSSFSGIASFESKSYIWHPNFMVLDINASYNPSVKKLASLVRPDYAYALDLKQLNASAIFLKQKKISFSARVNLSESYINIENITNTKRTNKGFGGSLRYVNKFAPINLSYDSRVSFSKDSNTNREQDEKGSSLVLNMSKSFKNNFESTLLMSHKKDDHSIGSRFQFNTTQTRILFTNKIDLTKSKQSKLMSRIDFNNHNFNNNKSERLQFFERLSLALSDDLNWTTNSNYSINNLGSGEVKRMSINTNLYYRLYESLFSRVNVSYNNTKTDFFKQTGNNYSFNTRYTKKIPFNGSLMLTYAYNKRINNTDGKSNILEVNDEEYILSDSEVVLLRNSNIHENSIVVRNNARTLIYEKDIDYVIIETGNFFEIQRIPGGLIENNSIVLISYTAEQPRDYTTNSNSNSFGVGVNLFNGILNFNYNYSNQNFNNASDINFEVDNYFNRYSYGAGINYKFFQGNLRYENFDSALVPYSSLSYNINLHGNYRQNILYSLDYRVNDYNVIQEQNRTEKREYITGMISYKFNRNTKLNFMLGYNKRKLNEIERDWLSGKVSFSTSLGALSFLADFNFYNAKTSDIEANYLGGNISIIRNF